MNKMVINHLEKLFVTSDTAPIIRELEVEHPAAKLMISGSQMQEQEIGDGTNFVIIFSGALLEAAEDLLRMVWCCPWCILQVFLLRVNQGVSRNNWMWNKSKISFGIWH